MATPLKISKLAWANFMSYGDYETELELSSLGPTLIVGQKEGRKDESNGVGKTTITTAIIWCLFGRLPRKAAPGDKVINWGAKGDCYVRITTTDGWIITRTRGINGHDDLLVHKDGEDVTLSTNKAAQVLLKKLFNLDYDIFVASMFFGQRTEPFLVMSDQKRKAALERLLGLNRLNVWGDVAKEYRTAAELEQQAIKALSEVRAIDIANIREQTKLAHKQADDFEINRAILVKTLKAEMLGTATQLKPLMAVNISELQAKYDQQETKRKELNDKRLQLDQTVATNRQLSTEAINLDNIGNQQKLRLASLGNADVDLLRKQHEQADADEQTKRNYQNTINGLILNQHKIEQKVQQLFSDLKNWDGKTGTNCPSCKQLISSEHAEAICKPYSIQAKELGKELLQIKGQIKEYQQQMDAIVISRPTVSVAVAMRDAEERRAINENLQNLRVQTDDIFKRMVKLRDLKLQLSADIELLSADLSQSDVSIQLEAAKQQINLRDQLKIQLSHLESRLKDEKVRDNPYNAMVRTFEAELDRAETDLSQHFTKIAELDSKIKSYDYIRHSYHDRNKIKMFILTGLIPYLNQRIEYYLNAFECDLTLKFTSTLSVETSRWDYDLHSGGQQKRIDLAIMLALYDLYISMYGQQCNVMVLDEVDGALDPHGVRMFVDIINNDFAGDRPDKPDTILVISHKQDMVDQFATQIVVSQDADGFSHILKG